MGDQGYDNVIRSNEQFWKIGFRQILNNRDLISLLVKRDFIASYKQTILGPIWFVIQPLLTTITFIVIFGKIAGISTYGTPMVLFYLSGILLWTFFSEVVIKTSDVFNLNSDLFSKVYFPRIVVPIASGILTSLKVLVTFGLYIIILLVYIFAYDYEYSSFERLFFFPIIALGVFVFGLGIGIICSSLTARFKDLKFLVQFGVQLLMFFSPVIYPIQTIPNKYQDIFLLNPMASFFEFERWCLTGQGTVSLIHLLYSFAFAAAVFIFGVMMFNRVERSFIDSV